jgi:hypothetical protein
MSTLTTSPILITYLAEYLGNEIKLDSKFSANKTSIDAVVLDVCKNMSEFVENQFPTLKLIFNGRITNLLAKLMIRLLQLYSFYQRAHSPCLFMSSLNSSSKKYKFCRNLGRNFDDIDRLHFINIGTKAANYFNPPLSRPIEYQMYKLDEAEHIMINSRMKTTDRFRAQETKSEIKFNEYITSKCESFIFNDIQPMLISYICCCLNDEMFRNVPFQIFCQDSSHLKYSWKYFERIFDARLTTPLNIEIWMKTTMESIVKICDFRNLREIVDGCGRKKRKQINISSDDDINFIHPFKRFKNQGDSDSTTETDVPFSSIQSLLMLAEQADSDQPTDLNFVIKS